MFLILWKNIYGYRERERGERERENAYRSTCPREPAAGVVGVVDRPQATF